MPHFEQRPVSWPALAIHGGAGTYARLGPPLRPDYAKIIADGITGALDAGWDLLTDDDPLAAVVASVAYLETHGAFNAGCGSTRTTLDTIEMDAGVMDSTGRTGAVACLRHASAVRTAEALLHDGSAVLLAGPGADQFANNHSIPRVVTPDTAPFAWPTTLSDQGTVGAVAATADGRFAVATSTGGRFGQLPGRVGDTPICGAGFWADHLGALTATGAGEAFIVTGFSRHLNTLLAQGVNPADAYVQALALVALHRGDGGAIALHRDSGYTAGYSTQAMARGLRHADGQHVVVMD